MAQSSAPTRITAREKWRTSFEMRNMNVMWWQWRRIRSGQFGASKHQAQPFYCWFNGGTLFAHSLNANMNLFGRKNGCHPNSTQLNQNLINDSFSCSCQTLIYRWLTKLSTVTNDTFQNIFLLSFSAFWPSNQNGPFVINRKIFLCKIKKKNNRMKNIRNFYLTIN